MFWQIATLIAVYADWGFAQIKGIGWDWAGVIWLYSIVFFIPLDLFKIFIRYVLSGKAWGDLLQRKVTSSTNSSKQSIVISLSVALEILICLHLSLQTAFTAKKDYGREEREAQWVTAQRTLHGLQPVETTNVFSDNSSYRELSEIAEQAMQRAEVASLVAS